jgi:hypothetical protein
MCRITHPMCEDLLLFVYTFVAGVPPYELVLKGSMDPAHAQHPPLPAPVKPKQPYSAGLPESATEQPTTAPTGDGNSGDSASAKSASAGTAAAAASWRAAFAPMRSAYREAAYEGKPAGSEPQFTNFAWSAFEPDEPFVDTLDYVFLSRNGWGPVASVKPLPLLVGAQAQSPVGFPVAHEPSDHLLLAADLVLLGP